MTVPYISENNISSWAQYSILAKSNSERLELIRHLNELGVPTAIFYKKIFSELSLFKSSQINTYNVSNTISNTIFSLPMHPYLDNKELDFIINAIKNFFNNKI